MAQAGPSFFSYLDTTAGFSAHEEMSFRTSQALVFVQSRFPSRGPSDLTHGCTWRPRCALEDKRTFYLTAQKCSLVNHESSCVVFLRAGLGEGIRCRTYDKGAFTVITLCNSMCSEGIISWQRLASPSFFRFNSKKRPKYSNMFINTKTVRLPKW